jgi:hypothetical protein
MNQVGKKASEFNNFLIIIGYTQIIVYADIID